MIFSKFYSIKLFKQVNIYKVKKTRNQHQLRIHHPNSIIIIGFANRIENPKEEFAVNSMEQELKKQAELFGIDYDEFNALYHKLPKTPTIIDTPQVREERLRRSMADDLTIHADTD